MKMFYYFSSLSELIFSDLIFSAQNVQKKQKKTQKRHTKINLYRGICKIPDSYSTKNTSKNV